MSLPTHLIETWITADTAGGRQIKDALDDLNTSLGTRHSWSRLWEWRNGSRPPPAAVARYALSRALPYLLARAGIRTPNELDGIVTALSPAERP